MSPETESLPNLLCSGSYQQLVTNQMSITTPDQLSYFSWSVLLC